MAANRGERTQLDQVAVRERRSEPHGIGVRRDGRADNGRPRPSGHRKHDGELGEAK